MEISDKLFSIENILLNECEAQFNGRLFCPFIREMDVRKQIIKVPLELSRKHLR
jgi:hypothetical protein